MTHTTSAAPATGHAPAGTAATARTITVRYFAAAAEAAGTTQEALRAGTVAELTAAMREAHGADLTRVLTRCSLLVAGRRTEPDATTELPEDAVVDVLPPFAGG